MPKATKTTKKAAAPKATKADKKAVAKKAAPSTAVIEKALSKSEIFAHISDEVGIAKKQVKEVFDAIERLMHRHLKKRGAGEFNLPGLLKCRIVRKPATKARKGINPFTKEEVTFKAKPARNVVKIRPLKKLKAMVE